MNMANCYCVLDKKSLVFNTPYFLINDDVAIRQFHSVVNNPESMVNKYPEDYTLYKVGSFDMLKGRIVPEDFPVEVMSALNLKMEVKTK